jgi:Vanadium chloroperoxidase N-terminal domain
MRKLTTVIGLVLILAAGLAGVGRPQPARAVTGDNLVLQWNEVTLQAIRDTRPFVFPTVAARALAIVHTAIYDAWAAYDPVAVDTRQRLRVTPGLRQPTAERTQANKEKAISYAAYATLVDLFPSQQPAFDEQMTTKLGYATDGSDTSTPVTVGAGAAQAVLNYRRNDGSNQAGGYVDSCVPVCYQPVNTPDTIVNPDHWQPLRLPNGTVQRFATPHWRNVTPFALTSAAQFRPDHGPAVSVIDGKPSGKYVQEVDQQLTYSANLTDTQKVIAQYWEDGPGTETPPGHWCVFAQWLSRRDQHSLDTDAKVFFGLGNALLDASITAWDAKRQWDSVRPITAVRWLKRGQVIKAWAGPYQGTKKIRAEDWMPYQPADFPTPPFAEYLSGHSTFSGAGAAVLKTLAGDKFGMSVTIPAGSSPVEPGAVPAAPVTLTWGSFSAAGSGRLFAGVWRDPF